MLDENNEKLSKQTLAKAIHTDSPENCLKALQGAAKHLGLNDERLYQENASRVSKWLEIAIENYRAILKSE